MWGLWKFILRHLARAQGFLDPMVVFSHLQHFSKPSEVWVPVELLRSGAVLQARGLINSQAIQNNLDWVWPFWVERQFDPKDRAFIPRAFNLTHINLTHRNWTALGMPNVADYPLVDPCGLVTPFFDGWSIDAWIIKDKSIFAPSRLPQVEQHLDLHNTFAVLTSARSEKFSLESRAEMALEKDPVCRIHVRGQSREPAWLMICIRPYNPEGISFINKIECLDQGYGWRVNAKEQLYLSQKPERYIFSNYGSGDISERMRNTQEENQMSIACKTGMATSAALYSLVPGKEENIVVTVPLPRLEKNTAVSWSDHMQGACALRVPDERMEFLYDVSIRTMILHSPGDIYPGPFTYKRFWFRDAAFILQTMMSVGLFKNMEKIIDRFPGRQTPTGYFMSQDGEWDSNGQTIWAMKRYIDTVHKPLKKEWRQSIYKAAKWIERKRYRNTHDRLHEGLLPAGFSAEHFGPSDFYYWDDYWAVAGLRAASSIAKAENSRLADEFAQQAEDMLKAIENSITVLEEKRQYRGLPASASRRMDAGAIGSLVASYPLQIYPAGDERIRQTVDFLMTKYLLQGAFYHELSHSGINIYLTLHLAQVLLRAGRPEFMDLVKAAADLASSTGQWPEAIHPGTKGGCMGDGQHTWASAEWVMMIRNMFVREEEAQGMIILCSGLPKEWLKTGETLFLGPTHTVYGEISVTLKVEQDFIHISWQAAWHTIAPSIEVRLPGYPIHQVKQGNNSHTVKI